MGHGRWVLDQRLHTAQGFCEGKNLRGGDEVFRLIQVVALDFEGNHSAKIIHLTRCDVVAGMVFKPRPVDLFDFGIVAQPVRYFPAVRTAALHAQMQRLQSSQDQERIERLGDGAAVVLQRTQRGVNGFVLRDECAHHYIAVAAQVFCDRVHDDVRTVLQRSLQHG